MREFVVRGIWDLDLWMSGGSDGFGGSDYGELCFRVGCRVTLLNPTEGFRF